MNCQNIDGAVYVAEAVGENDNKTLRLVSAYIETQGQREARKDREAWEIKIAEHNKKPGMQATHASDGLRGNVRNEAASSPDSITILETTTNSNTQTTETAPAQPIQPTPPSDAPGVRRPYTREAFQKSGDKKRQRTARMMLRELDALARHYNIRAVAMVYSKRYLASRAQWFTFRKREKGA